MKSLTYRKNNLEIEYITFRAPKVSNYLVAVFPGAGGVIGGTEWPYLFTLKKINVNAIFFRAKEDLISTYMILKNGNLVVYDTLRELILKISIEFGCNNIIAAGSSMGGVCALYYGLKNNWDIISGAPCYKLDVNETQLESMMGNCSNKSRNYVKNLIKNTIIERREKFNKRIFLSFGSGERYYKDNEQAKSLFDDLRLNKYIFEKKIFPYSDHTSAKYVFPDVLECTLKFYLGLTSTNEIQMKLLSSDDILKTTNFVDESYDYISNVIQSIDLCNNIDLNINNMHFIGYNNFNDVLKEFVYLNSGYILFDNKHPIKISKNKYKKAISYNKVKDIRSFWFQNSLLKYHDKELLFLKWCITYAKLIFSDDNFSYICNYNHTSCLRILYFLINLHLLSKKYDLSDGIFLKFPKLIQHFMLLLCKKRHSSVLHTDQLYILFIFLVCSKYFSLYNCFSKDIFNVLVKTINKLTNFLFDENGLCTVGQVATHLIYTYKLKIIYDFIKNNNFIYSSDFNLFEAKFKKIYNLSKFMHRPDMSVAPLGDTSSRRVYLPDFNVETYSSNLILKSSNIGFLCDHRHSSYITVNCGKSNHSNYKHCDLLSFTWYYDNLQIFYDAGGGKEPLDTYAASPEAHNSLIIENCDYTIPNHFDFTTINNFTEKDDYVIINMSHNQYEESELYRLFIWLKPNIIILLDCAKSKLKRYFTQNFLLGDFKIESDATDKVTINLNKDTTLQIKQHLNTRDTIFSSNAKQIVNDKSSKIRGFIIDKYVTLLPALNITYTVNAYSAIFLTSLEIGCKKRLDEALLKFLRIEEGKLFVNFNDKNVYIDIRDLPVFG